jgi:glycosyltransferase involved in cell wall biosynthesis
MPREELSKKLGQYDVLFFVVGFSAWAYVAIEADRPYIIWSATTFASERDSKGNGLGLLRTTISMLSKPLIELQEERALQGASAVFALSKHTEKNLGNLMKGQKPILAPYGIDSTKFSPGEGTKREHILCVGRLLDPRKNIRMLLRAHRIARESCTCVPRLMLAGNFDPEVMMRWCREEGGAEDVDLRTQCTEAELIMLYRGASCFVLCSREEGLGIVLLEAMACGIPVISTRCGGPETIVEDNVTGLLCSVDDERELADKIITVAENLELAFSLGKNGRQRVEVEFSEVAVQKKFKDEVMRAVC